MHRSGKCTPAGWTRVATWRSASVRRRSPPRDLNACERARRVVAMFYVSRKSARHQAQRNRVDAVALVGGRRIALALEDVAEMAVAIGAQHLGAGGAHRMVGAQDHRVGVRRVEE